MADDIKVVEPKQKIKVDLEVDTSVKDLGVNPYAKLIHMARAVDAWRIFPRLVLVLLGLVYTQEQVKVKNNGSKRIRY
jgi:hypothetical protein